ncbi:TetR/AcrR family transcriptional regulator [Sphingobacterium bambusae]|uniref:TetR/AcrR family transcriptional regulator n=1 Tax=Sphingobacterium bambusae TaxID=662858 RepID=A0ABW6BBW1_9SPHI|nr:TetR/AcrR family transcriptional regulator [Sphingobacterium bambusae]WPL48291.1 TetR/AcrR family transcriptional regulator [Sphingobacterium bambusae]
MDNKKDQIIQAALKRFAHYGFNKTTMSEIAVDLNITKANLYYYYPDKNALIKDVLVHISEDILQSQYAIIEGYDSNLVAVLHALLEKRANYLRDYYVLHISENLEWIKGQGVGTVLEEMHVKDKEMMTVLFEKAVAAGEVTLDNVAENAACYIEIIKGLSLIRSVADVLSGMPNAYNVDEILDSQKRTTEFVFKNKIISKN